MTLAVQPKSSLVYAASNRKHRPASHPLLAATPVIATEAEFYAYVARRIWLRRKERGWSQRDLGAALEVTGVTVCHWERGDNHPSAWHLERLERVLGGIRP